MAQSNLRNIAVATINAAPGKVYDARAVGCFCERLEEQGSAQHAAVIYAAPVHSVLSGQLQRLQKYVENGSPIK